MYLEQGKTKEESIELTARPMWAFVEKGAAVYKKLVKIPGALKIVGVMMKKGGENWDAPGWRYTYEVTTAKKFKFTCHQCIYRDIYETYLAAHCFCSAINYKALRIGDGLMEISKYNGKI